VDAGNADIVILLHAVAHDVGGDDGFFGDRDVGGAGAEHGDGAGTFRQRLADDGDGAAASWYRVFGKARLTAR